MSCLLVEDTIHLLKGVGKYSSGVQMRRDGWYLWVDVNNFCSLVTARVNHHPGKTNRCFPRRLYDLEL